MPKPLASRSERNGQWPRHAVRNRPMMSPFPSIRYSAYVFSHRFCLGWYKSPRRYLVVLKVILPLLSHRCHPVSRPLAEGQWQRSVAGVDREAIRTVWDGQLAKASWVCFIRSSRHVPHLGSRTRR